MSQIRTISLDHDSGQAPGNFQVFRVSPLVREAVVFDGWWFITRTRLDSGERNRVCLVESQNVHVCECDVGEWCKALIIPVVYEYFQFSSE